MTGDAKNSCGAISPGARISITGRERFNPLRRNNLDIVTLKTGKPYFAGKNYSVAVSKDGFQPVTANLKSTVSAAYADRYAGNAIFDGLIGLLIVALVRNLSCVEMDFRCCEGWSILISCKPGLGRPNIGFISRRLSGALPTAIPIVKTTAKRLVCLEAVIVTYLAEHVSLPASSGQRGHFSLRKVVPNPKFLGSNRISIGQVGENEPDHLRNSQATSQREWDCENYGQLQRMATAENATPTRTFTVTVRPMNDPPTIFDISNQRTPLNDADPANQSLLIPLDCLIVARGKISPTL